MSAPEAQPGVNGVECLTCGATIVSQHRHDHVSCNCTNESGTRVSVDGGSDYSKRGYGTGSRWRELSNNAIRSGADTWTKPPVASLEPIEAASATSLVDQLLAPGVLPDALRIPLGDYRPRIAAALGEGEP